MRTVVALDSSPFALSAGELAVSLAKGTPGTQLTAVHIVNVVSPSGNPLKDLPGRLGFEPAVVSAEEEERRLQNGRLLLGRCKEHAHAAGVEVATVLESGPILERIIDWTKRSDMLVMGARGETETRFPGQGGGLLHKLLAQTACPVLMVPKAFKAVTGIVAGYDGSEPAARALGAVRELATALNVPVHLVHVSKTGQDGGLLEDGAKLLPGIDVVKHAVKHDLVAVSLYAVAGSAGANLVVVGLRGRSPLKELVFGSTAEYLVDRCDLALFLAR